MDDLKVGNFRPNNMYKGSENWFWTTLQNGRGLLDHGIWHIAPGHGRKKSTFSNFKNFYIGR